MAGLSAFTAVLVGVALWLVLADDEYVAPPPEDGKAAIQPAQAAAALQDLVDAVRSGDQAAAAELAPVDDSQAGERLRTLVRNATAIRLQDFSLRYLDALGGIDSEGRWSAAVRMTWGFAGFDGQPSVAEVEIGFVSDQDRVAIRSLGGDHGRVPTWLVRPVEVARGPETLVVAANDVNQFDRMARRAVATVHRVIPGWTDGLVVEVPATGRALDRALGAKPSTFANIAGVTSPPGESQTADSPVHVFLNPEGQQLRRKGTQIVLSHEAAHVALGATDTELPTWLTEGFADYIALRDVRLPLSTTASQIIDQVRRHGTPRELPDEDDFDEDSERFGAAYESAWLACRLLAERAGERALLRFYRQADGEEDFESEFRSTFGIDLRTFTREWRSSLSDLAA